VKPDFVFPSLHLAVFVDGCFWHGCPMHSCPEKWLQKSSMPELPGVKSGNSWTRTGKKFWREKMGQNRARDRRANRALRAAGWRVLRIWEHELEQANLERVLRKLRKVLSLPPQSAS